MFKLFREDKTTEKPKSQSCAVYARNGSYYVKTCHYAFDGKGQAQELGPGFVLTAFDATALGQAIYKALEESIGIPGTKTMEEGDAQRREFAATLEFYGARSWSDLYKTSSRVTVERTDTVMSISKWTFSDQSNALAPDGKPDVQEYLTPEKLGQLVMEACPMPVKKAA